MATTYRDYYEILGVPRTATPKEIKAAFRRLARRHHPDVNPGDAAAEARFKEINEANEVLSDPEKRKKYDTYGPQWEQYEQWERAGRPGAPPFGQGGGGAGQPGAGQPEVEYRTVSPEDLEDLFGEGEPFSDFFHDMFGQGAGARGGTARPPRPRRGSDLEAETDVTLEEVHAGTTRTLEIEQGDGSTRRVQVRIPPGIGDGARVRAGGQGSPGRSGGAAGDLYVRVHVLPHSAFRREGDDVHVRVPVPLEVALLGGEVEVPTLKGTRVRLRVPEGTQNGARLRLRGQGLPRLRGEGTGDLIAEVDVRLPVPLTPEWRALAEAVRQDREASHARG